MIYNKLVGEQKQKTTGTTKKKTNKISISKNEC